MRAKIATIGRRMDMSADGEQLARCVGELVVESSGWIVAETVHADRIAKLAAGTLPITSAARWSALRSVRLGVVESPGLTALLERAGVPVVRLTGDDATDVEHVSWMIDAPHAVPLEVLHDRAQLADVREREVAARSRNRLRRLILRTRRAVFGDGWDAADIPWSVGRRPPVSAAPTLPALSRAPRVSVVVPTLDRPDLLARVLEGLATTTWPDLEVTIVDNGSTDPDAQSILAATHHRVERLPIGFNFPRLVNRGATASTGEILVFLNNDIEILDPRWLEPLVTLAAQAGSGPVGCLLTYPDETIQHCGMAIGPRGPEHPLRGVSKVVAPAQAYAAGARTGVTGACLAIRADVFWALGGFDPLLKRDFNDIDLCLRAWEAGYRVWYTPDTELIHHESRSRGPATHPDTLGDWLIMRKRWADALSRPDKWWSLDTSHPRD